MSEDRENYYILLELPFNPPEQNAEVIQKAIEKKRQQWSKDQLVAFKKANAPGYYRGDDRSGQACPGGESRETDQR